MAFYKTPTLETERLILRPVTIEDAPTVQRLFRHWDIIKYIGEQAPWPYPENGALQFYTDIQLPKLANGEIIAFGITLKSDQTMIGAIDLYPSNMESQLGFWLGLPYHNKYFMTEAVTAIIDYGFNVVGMPSIHTENAAHNIPSHKTQVKTGANLIGINQSKYGGELKPQEQWLLTPARWRDSPMKRGAADPSYKLLSQ